MTTHTRDLIGPDLDWHVAQIEKMPVKIIDGKCIFVGRVDTWANPGSLKGILTGQPFNPSTRHGIGGLIMDREFIGTAKWIGQDEWTACYENGTRAWGPTRLVAAMRCFVMHHRGWQVSAVDPNGADVEMQIY